MREIKWIIFLLFSFSLFAANPPHSSIRLDKPIKKRLVPEQLTAAPVPVLASPAVLRPIILNVKGILLGELVVLVQKLSGFSIGLSPQSKERVTFHLKAPDWQNMINQIKQHQSDLH